jgi:hypothetical protein
MLGAAGVVIALVLLLTTPKSINIKIAATDLSIEKDWIIEKN